MQSRTTTKNDVPKNWGKESNVENRKRRDQETTRIKIKQANKSEKSAHSYTRAHTLAHIQQICGLLHKHENYHNQIGIICGVPNNFCLEYFLPMRYDGTWLFHVECRGGSPLCPYMYEDGSVYVLLSYHCIFNDNIVCFNTYKITKGTYPCLILSLSLPSYLLYHCRIHGFRICCQIEFYLFFLRKTNAPTAH